MSTVIKWNSDVLPCAQILGNVLLQGRRKLKQIHVSVCTQIFETGMTQAGQTTALQSSTPTCISWMLKAVGWDFLFVCLAG